MEQTISYATRMSVSDAAEQSRIATAQGMRDVAAALRERGANSHCSDDDGVSVSSTDSSERRHKRRRRDKTVSRTNDGEKQAHYLKLELANAHVDIDDLKAEVAKMKAILDPYSAVNNGVASPTVFDKSYTKFIARRDSYADPETGDSYLKFPKTTILQ